MKTPQGSMAADDGLTVLKCWRCKEGKIDNFACCTCGGTGAVFWAGGYAFAYNPEGEKRALAQMAKSK